jgi:hypothetical protein
MARLRARAFFSDERLGALIAEFIPENWDLNRGVDANSDPIGLYREHGESDVTTDVDLFAGLPAEDEHGNPPCRKGTRKRLGPSLVPVIIVCRCGLLDKSNSFAWIIDNIDVC